MLCERFSGFWMEDFSFFYCCHSLGDFCLGFWDWKMKDIIPQIVVELLSEKTLLAFFVATIVKFRYMDKNLLNKFHFYCLIFLHGFSVHLFLT